LFLEHTVSAFQCVRPRSSPHLATRGHRRHWGHRVGGASKDPDHALSDECPDQHSSGHPKPMGHEVQKTSRGMVEVQLCLCAPILRGCVSIQNVLLIDFCRQSSERQSRLLLVATCDAVRNCWVGNKRLLRRAPLKHRHRRPYSSAANIPGITEIQSTGIMQKHTLPRRSGRQG
jgi:hypothetical protein